MSLRVDTLVTFGVEIYHHVDSGMYAYRTGNRGSDYEFRNLQDCLREAVSQKKNTSQLFSLDEYR
jgi:hypothetical protein